jgi:REP-associated tyrosine transposase
MLRPTRIENQGAFHHVMNRGQDRYPIFRDDEDYQTFLTALQEASKQHSARIHANCLMSNH